MHFVWATQLCKEKSEVKFQMQYYILVLYLLDYLIKLVLMLWSVLLTKTVFLET